jgi:hypothetical protein
MIRHSMKAPSSIALAVLLLAPRSDRRHDVRRAGEPVSSFAGISMN